MDKYQSSKKEKKEEKNLCHHPRSVNPEESFSCQGQKILHGENENKRKKPKNTMSR